LAQSVVFVPSSFRELLVRGQMPGRATAPRDAAQHAGQNARFAASSNMLAIRSSLPAITPSRTKEKQQQMKQVIKVIADRYC
jgi:hypothetical protein